MIFYFPLVTLPLIGPIAAYEWVTPEGWQWWVLLSVGVTTQIAQYCMTVAYQMEKAANIMVYNYSGLFWGVIFGYVLFNEALTLTQMTGIVLVFICLCGSFFTTQKRKSLVSP